MMLQRAVTFAFALLLPAAVFAQANLQVRQAPTSTFPWWVSTTGTVQLASSTNAIGQLSGTSSILTYQGSVPWNVGSVTGTITVATSSNTIGNVGHVDSLTSGTLTSSTPLQVTLGGGYSNLRFSATGTWTGQINIQGAVSSTFGWTSISGQPIPINSGARVTSITANGMWESRVAGLQVWRLVSDTTTAVSGTAQIVVAASVGTDLVGADIIADGSILYSTSSAILPTSTSISSPVIDARAFTSIQVLFRGTQSSATSNGCVILSSLDGVSWSTSTVGVYDATLGPTGGPKLTPYVYGRRGLYMQFVYTNGPTSSVVDFAIIGQRGVMQITTVGLTEGLTDLQTGITTRSTLTGRTPSTTTYYNAGVTIADAQDTDPGLVVRNILPFNSQAEYGMTLNAEDQIIAYLNTPYVINPIISTTTTVSTGSVSSSNGMMWLQTGTSPTGSAQLESKGRARYIPGVGMDMDASVVFTSACVTGNTVEVGYGDTTDGYFFGCSSSTGFGVLWRQNGVDNWVPSSSWNGNASVRATISPAQGNLYKISLASGFGPVRWWIMNPNTGQFIVAHTLQYTNQYTVPSAFNRSYPLHIRILNTGSTANNQVYSAAMGIKSEGPHLDVVHALHSIGATYASVPVNANSAIPNPTSTMIVQIQNKTTFSGKPNRTAIRLTSVSYRVTQTGGSAYDIVFYLILNPTTPSASFQDINTAYSIAAYDETATSTSGGQVLKQWMGESATCGYIDLSTMGIFVQPGDTLACGAVAETNAASVRCAINWDEEF